MQGSPFITLSSGAEAGHRQTYNETRGVAYNKDSYKQKLREKCLQQTKDLRFQAMVAARLRAQQNAPAPQAHASAATAMDTDNPVRGDLATVMRQQMAEMQVEHNNPDMSMSAEEEAELMQFLEEALYRDLKQMEEQALEGAKHASEFMSWDQSALRNMVDDKVMLACPLCKKNPLQQVNKVILCRCGLRIDTRDDATDLAYLHQNIAELVAEHAYKCDKDPQFELRTNFGLSALYMVCPYCSTRQVVI